MTPSEKTIAKSLVVVAWADGEYQAPEQGMIDSLLWAFDASEAEEKELKEYAAQKRTLKDDLPLNQLTPADRELLLAHAALLTHADGDQTPEELKLLSGLVERLGFTQAQAKPIIEGARQRAAKLAQRLG